MSQHIYIGPYVIVEGRRPEMVTAVKDGRCTGCRRQYQPTQVPAFCDRCGSKTEIVTEQSSSYPDLPDLLENDFSITLDSAGGGMCQPNRGKLGIRLDGGSEEKAREITPASIEEQKNSFVTLFSSSLTLLSRYFDKVTVTYGVFNSWY